MRWLVVGLICWTLTPARAQAPKPGEKRPIDPAQAVDLAARMDRLEGMLAPIKGRTFGEKVRGDDALADASVMLKAGRWIVRHGEFYAEDSVAKTIRVLDLGARRAESLARGIHPWTEAKGGSARGFVSKIDGSVQPYAVYVPESYDGSNRMRLDVILHGRDATLTEVKFVLAHEGKPYPKGEEGLILHVFGRGNNAYRWAGETDVFEAIDAAKRNYRVDDRRILLRGFSMGGAGAWHLGLHHPFLWASVEAGAGFTETRSYAKLKDGSDDQAKRLRIYDATDYAANARNVPIAGYGGEDDPQLKASTNIVEALRAQGVPLTTEGPVTKAQGLPFLRVVGAKMGHKIDPASEAILKAFRDDHAREGRPETPKSVRFSTYTTRYANAGWIAIESLRDLYARATVEGDLEGETAVVRTENVTALAIDRGVAESVKLDGQTFPLRSAIGGLLPRVSFRKIETGWEPLDYRASRALQENAARTKRPGLQGPIDDAFSGAFLCVRGTGPAWNPNVGAWSKARLDRFAAEWSEYLRGDLPVKDDRDVTPADVESRHLVLFGDPGSNSWIARTLPDLPISWTKTAVGFSASYPASDHVPALIVASPLNPLKYLVINSGHTFGAKDFEGTNALLYPRLGDRAILRVGGSSETTAESGFLDARWR